jgi:hypothetical protein
MGPVGAGHHGRVVFIAIALAGLLTLAFVGSLRDLATSGGLPTAV